MREMETCVYTHTHIGTEMSYHISALSNARQVSNQKDRMKLGMTQTAQRRQDMLAPFLALQLEVKHLGTTSPLIISDV